MPKVTKKASRRKRKATLEKNVASVAQEVELKPLNRQQDAAIKTIQKNHITFLTGPAGTGKTHVACGYAVSEVANGNAEQIVVTRPIVEAGESLGFLPGTLTEKVNPYLLPLFDSITKLAGKTGKRRDEINASLVIAPLAYMRGRTFDNAVVVVDEAQNCTEEQLRLVISRLGKDSKIILAGDISQSDLRKVERALYRVINKLSHISGVGVYRFTASSIVRHPVLAAVLEAWK
jgi:phosphate starvation-inducible PhoH-like protein